MKGETEMTHLQPIEVAELERVQGGAAPWVIGIVFTGPQAALDFAFRRGAYGPYLT
jgi:hypothetical protein